MASIVTAGESFDEKSVVGALIKTSLVDFPGCVGTVLFLKGCNLRCPYCYNRGLVLRGEDDTLQTLEEVKSHLEKRKEVIQGFVLSGGEPLLHPAMPHLIEYAKNLGYKIKLDTNGTLPDLLEKIVKNEKTRPDFIAMDLKTASDKYEMLGGSISDASRASATEENLKKSIKIMTENYSGENREWRTVLVPPLVDVEDVKKMADLLPRDAKWMFANFRNENCLDEKYNEIAPYLDKEIEEIVGAAKEMIPNAELR